ncbi:endonuclease/exonuclease/phosphatase family protein [Horticoccus sp. 23ND18S-11]|uniref:endonuclease/exonuclease/phosphatase family protein n=1 Tax=Horticoccus sp. 23ND18S-11 TaxID=3391832 RepID=UPI0039C902A5
MTSRFLLLFTVLVSVGLAQTPASFRVLCYNIHHGEGLDGKLDLERIAKLITDAKADIVALQEVDRGVERTQKRDLPAELAKLTGLTVHFEKNIAHQGGEYGNAVLTRFPIKRARNTHLRMVGPGEQRGVLQLVLDVNGRDVLFMNTHLDARRDPVERERSAGELKEIVAAAGRMPVILCGDFNAAPDSAAVGKIREVLTDTWKAVGQGDGFTIPVRKPTKRIDYVWITPDSITPVSMAVLSSEASDHLPIVAELKLR